MGTAHAPLADLIDRRLRQFGSRLEHEPLLPVFANDGGHARRRVDVERAHSFVAGTFDAIHHNAGATVVAANEGDVCAVFAELQRAVLHVLERARGQTVDDDAGAVLPLGNEDESFAVAAQLRFRDAVIRPERLRAEDHEPVGTAFRCVRELAAVTREDDAVPADRVEPRAVQVFAHEPLRAAVGVHVGRHPALEIVSRPQVPRSARARHQNENDGPGSHRGTCARVSVPRAQTVLPTVASTSKRCSVSVENVHTTR